MHIRDAFNETLTDFSAGNSVIWIGDPGGGKTYQSYMLYKKLCALHPTLRIGLCRSFMANKEPTDFLGMPGRSYVEMEGKKVPITEYAVPSCFISEDGKLATDDAGNFDRVLTVIEEWGQGHPDTKRCATSLILEKGISGFYYPEGSWILLLTNSDSRDGVTKEYDFTINRWREKRIRPDVTVWDEDFASRPYIYEGRQWKVSSLTRAWGVRNPEAIAEPKPKTQGPWSTFRSATANDRYMQEAAAAHNGKLPIDKGSFLECVEGGIGTAATQSLMTYAEWHLNLPTYENVVNDPQATAMPGSADQQMLMVYMLAGAAQPDHLDKVIEYVTRKDMPADMAFTFASTLVRRDKRFVVAPPMQAWIGKNSTLLTALAAITNAAQ